MERTTTRAFVSGSAAGATLTLLALLAYAWLPEPASDQTYAISYSLSSHEPPSFTEPASNFIANDRQVLPALITACGARFLTFDGAVSDEMEYAYFAITPGGADELSCISKRAPHLHVDRPDPEVVKNRLSWETIAYFAGPRRVKQGQ